VSLPCLRQIDTGVEITLNVQPRASRNKIVGLQDGALKIALTAPPVDGAANKACCALLAKLFKQPKRCVKLISGETSRHKRWLLEGTDLAEIKSLLEPLLGA
jgi:uncharacterized protein (TIGR00251 family)